MEKYHIKLTEEEAGILSKIDLRSNHHNHDEGRAAYLGNKELIPALLTLLGSRGAVPEMRLKYWTDPKYQMSRTKGSRKDLLESNGWRGDELYTSPYFIEHLRYFLFGAELPDAVIVEFEAMVGNPEWVTSSDIVPIGKTARDLTRKNHLDKHTAPGEFFKLCLDMGLSLYTAQSVMESVKKAR